MHSRTTSMYIIFSKIDLVDLSKPCTHNYLPKKLLKFETTNINLEKNIISDMHHSITYMYIKFQQIRVSKPV